MARFEGGTVPLECGAAALKGKSSTRMAPPHNKSLQRTEQTVTRFAWAKRAPVRSAAELGRYATHFSRLPTASTALPEMFCRCLASRVDTQSAR